MTKVLSSNIIKLNECTVFTIDTQHFGLLLGGETRVYSI